MVKKKVDPTSGSLSTLIDPPISLTSCSEIASPSPVPPYFRVVEVSICENALKRRSCFSGGIPMPVSRTSNPRVSFPSASDCYKPDTDEDLAFFGELDGVADEVGDDLSQAKVIALDKGGHPALYLVEQFDAGLLRRGC